MIQFSLFKIPIRVELWFWLTLAFIGGVLGVDGKEAFFLLLLFMGSSAESVGEFRLR